MDFITSIRWVVALKAEAISIIEQYKLVSYDHKGPFPIYKSKLQDIWLIVSGIGQVNSAAASIYLFEKSTKFQNSVWINIGIAGFESSYGSIFKVDKIISHNNKKTFYPSAVVKNKIPYATLLTVDEPDTNYSKDYMIDMEGAAFYQTVSKISSHELILILKIISDNSRNEIKKINTINIQNLFKEKLPFIKECLSGYLEISNEECIRNRQPKDFEILISKFHFTISQQYVLNTLIKKFNALFPNKNLIDFIKNCKDSKSIINQLNTLIDQNLVDWGKS